MRYQPVGLDKARKQSFALLKSLRSNDADRVHRAVARFRQHPHFLGRSDEEILAEKDRITNNHAFAVIAIEWGYESWNDLRTALAFSFPLGECASKLLRTAPFMALFIRIADIAGTYHLEIESTDEVVISKVFTDLTDRTMIQMVAEHLAAEFRHRGVRAFIDLDEWVDYLEFGVDEDLKRLDEEEAESDDPEIEVVSLDEDTFIQKVGSFWAATKRRVLS